MHNNEAVFLDTALIPEHLLPQKRTDKTSEDITEVECNYYF